MRDPKNNLTTSGKGLTNIQSRRTKSFGYQVLGFGAGGEPIKFISATGGTVTEDGDDKIHKFTGPGTFCVSAVSTVDDARNAVSFLVVAGGGNGGQIDANNGGGGGGGGGVREFKSPLNPYTASPIEGSTPVTVTATGYPITTGAGGSNPSTFSTITSAGGGFGGGASGGSGGGGTPIGTSGGSGNTPPVSPPQGQDGGNSIAHGGVPTPQRSGGGGGGAGGAGGAGSAGSGGSPGPGTPTNITDSNVTYSQGGQGAPGNTASGSDIGAINTGNGNGGRGGPAALLLGSSGIVVIRYKFQ